MENYFRGTEKNPYHISIGGVIVNDEGKICCHYFKTIEHPNFGDFKNFYLLLRETIEPHESIEVCLARGLEEEFGIIATLQSYLGSTVTEIELVTENNAIIQKTTLYFLCKFVSIDQSKRKEDDAEATSEIVWFEPKELIEKMREQGVRLNNKTMDESAIIERFIKNQK